MAPLQFRKGGQGVLLDGLLQVLEARFAIVAGGFVVSDPLEVLCELGAGVGGWLGYHYEVCCG